MKVGVIIAMDKEFRMMHDTLGGDMGHLGNNDIILWQCGIGKVNAAIGTMRLIEQHYPDAIISTGLAGGIDPSTHVLDIIAATQTVYHDVWCGDGNECGQVQGLPARYDADDYLLGATLKAANDERLLTGVICTGDQFITNRDALNTIKRHFPDGLACDMESAAIAQTCYILKIPFMSLRIISDTPGRTENHTEQYYSVIKMCDRSFQFVKHYLETL